MTNQRSNVASKSSSDHEKIAEIERMILLRQRNAEMFRATQKGTGQPKNIPSLSEEFFEGLDIV